MSDVVSSKQVRDELRKAFEESEKNRIEQERKEDEKRLSKKRTFAQMTTDKRDIGMDGNRFKLDPDQVFNHAEGVAVQIDKFVGRIILDENLFQ